MAHVFKNLWERHMAKNYLPVSLIFLISKVFKKLVNNRLVDQTGEIGPFSDFNDGFMFS